MASRFRIGGTSNWDNSTTNWSATSGGTGGQSVPGSGDNVFIDANTGSSPTITATVAINALNLDFTGAITPVFVTNSTFFLYGSLTLISGMTYTHNSQTLTFKSTTTGKTITSAGVTLGAFDFDGVGGGWTLQDNLSAGITLTNGNLNTNSKNITCSGFSSNNSNTRVLSLGNSIITCTGGQWVLTTTTGLTFDAGTSTIIMNDFFRGGGLTYHNVTMNANLTVFGNNSYNLMTLTPGKTIKLTAGNTQTFASLSAMGTLGNVISLQSATASSPATISQSSGVVTFNYCSIKDITATGGATFNAYNSTNVSGNTGINFLGGDPPSGHKVMGQTISKVNGVTPSKVNGV